MTTNTAMTATPTNDADASTPAATTPVPQVTWFEVHTPNPTDATEFYGGLFGWTFTDEAGGTYYDIRQVDGQAIGGGVANTGGEWPAQVIPCVQVSDVAGTCGRAGDLGGKVLAGPNQTPNGITFAYLADRDGSAFGVWCPPAQA